MVYNVVAKPLGLLLIAAHMVFNGSSRVEVTRYCGANVTLKFTFNVSIKENQVGIYKLNHTKIAQCVPKKSCSGDAAFNIRMDNYSIYFHIMNLTKEHSNTYWAVGFNEHGKFESNNKVHLTIREEERRSSTVPPVLTNSTVSEHSLPANSITISPSVCAALVVPSVLLLAIALSWLIWFHVRSKGKQQSFTPEVQETSVPPTNAPAPSLVYSVLDFPKRPSAVLEMDPSNTEYAAVSYQQ